MEKSLPASSRQVTDLLHRWRSGDREALESLIPLVYGELRKLAQYYLRSERPGHTLQGTALVNEAFVRLVGMNPPALEDRTHFFGIAAKLMREILVEYARARHAEKRGGGDCKLTLDESLGVPQAPDVDLLLLDDALKELSRLDERQSRIIELRFFTGLSLDETAEVLGISAATVSRDWTTARAWLYREIARGTNS
jgi:RNA polymerase sigma factor (TIGR02999 family)